MEDKKYEAGRVEISSAEYRDLVTEAVTAKNEAYQHRNEKWKLEDELKKCKKELADANKRVEELEGILSALQVGIAPNTAPWWSQDTCLTNIKKEND